ncbi:MAG: hypothetical protein MMC33_004944 [Icmadophila ericetorum]|nr:hypothetical protein [Icmadophila ericetorum]
MSTSSPTNSPPLSTPVRVAIAVRTIVAFVLTAAAGFVVYKYLRREGLTLSITCTQELRTTSRRYAKVRRKTLKQLRPTNLPGTRLGGNTDFEIGGITVGRGRRWGDLA